MDLLSELTEAPLETHTTPKPDALPYIASAITNTPLTLPDKTTYSTLKQQAIERLQARVALKHIPVPEHGAHITAQETYIVQHRPHGYHAWQTATTLAPYADLIAHYLPRADSPDELKALQVLIGSQAHETPVRLLNLKPTDAANTILLDTLITQIEQQRTAIAEKQALHEASVNAHLLKPLDAYRWGKLQEEWNATKERILRGDAPFEVAYALVDRLADRLRQECDNLQFKTVVRLAAEHRRKAKIQLFQYFNTPVPKTRQELEKALDQILTRVTQTSDRQPQAGDVVRVIGNTPKHSIPIGTIAFVRNANPTRVIVEEYELSPSDVQLIVAAPRYRKGEHAVIYQALGNQLLRPGNDYVYGGHVSTVPLNSRCKISDIRDNRSLVTVVNDGSWTVHPRELQPPAWEQFALSLARHTLPAVEQDTSQLSVLDELLATEQVPRFDIKKAWRRNLRQLTGQYAKQAADVADNELRQNRNVPSIQDLTVHARKSITATTERLHEESRNISLELSRASTLLENAHEYKNMLDELIRKL
ncbi:hypothetical protein HY490_02130 [Candidatus Woesearchaeota archaeon]|nr:hypothetical protein [Candidatus Woesearchaeota archaeon]